MSQEQSSQGKKPQKDWQDDLGATSHSEKAGKSGEIGRRFNLAAAQGADKFKVMDKEDMGKEVKYINCCQQRFSGAGHLPNVGQLLLNQEPHTHRTPDNSTCTSAGDFLSYDWCNHNQLEILQIEPPMLKMNLLKKTPN